MTAAVWNGCTWTGWAWIVLALIGVVAVTQAVGWSGARPVAITQSLTPWLAVPTLAAALIGLVAGAPVLGVTAALVLAGIAVVVVPASLGRARTDPASTCVLRLFHGNLWFENVDAAGELAVAILAVGADVLAMSEITSYHERALMARGAADRYPHRCGLMFDDAEGMAVWSRHPFVTTDAVPMQRRAGIVATVEVGGREVRIVLAHPEPPVRLIGLRDWAPSMHAIGSVGSRPGPPTVIVADFNAARWHPPFRRLLRSGWRDAHEQIGRGLSGSWPVKRPIPGPFVRLDHALLGHGLAAIAVDDIDLPGSDHRGFAVDLAFADEA